MFGSAGLPSNHLVVGRLKVCSCHVQSSYFNLDPEVGVEPTTRDALPALPLSYSGKFWVSPNDSALLFAVPVLCPARGAFDGRCLASPTNCIMKPGIQLHSNHQRVFWTPTTSAWRSEHPLIEFSCFFDFFKEQMHIALSGYVTHTAHMD